MYINQSAICLAGAMESIVNPLSGMQAYRHTGDAANNPLSAAARLAKPRHGLKSKPVSQKQTIALKLQLAKFAICKSTASKIRSLPKSRCAAG
ncbi:hypothetical protein [uncultured Campylobacter sp.]|uniref:hypothetical protein n=1 Tax=uncultured Campylobacter sp. TaxID=218934 RepID=UPI002623A806|nr:hypothetical protein [uncultured Campylobacter sp.]